MFPCISADSDLTASRCGLRGDLVGGGASGRRRKVIDAVGRVLNRQDAEAGKVLEVSFPILSLGLSLRAQLPSALSTPTASTPFSKKPTWPSTIPSSATRPCSRQSVPGMDSTRSPALKTGSIWAPRALAERAAESDTGKQARLPEALQWKDYGSLRQTRGHTYPERPGRCQLLFPG